MPNRGAGIELKIASSLTRIGTNADGQGDDDERNVISGNASDGIVIRGADGGVVGSGVTQTTVAGNYIGTTVAGTAALPNAGSGVDLANTASNNMIGGATPAVRNVLFPATRAAAF